MFKEINELVFIFSLSFAISAILVPVIIYFCNKFCLFDYVDGRKVHKNEISRLGGIAIFIGFIMPFCFYIIPKSHYNINLNLYIAALAIIFSIGLFDDIFNISAQYKLVLQIISASLVSASGLNINAIPFLGIDFTECSMENICLVSHIITIVWIVFFINAMNFLDGIDGLASGIFLIAFFFTAVLTFNDNLIFVGSFAITAIGTVFGFYIFNFPPAKIFMGDSGAYTIGFLAATLPLFILEDKLVSANFFVPLAIFIIPVVDAIYVIFRRIKNKSNIFHGDRCHIHHRLENLGLRDINVLIILYGFTIAGGLLSLVVSNINSGQYLYLMFIFFSILSICYYFISFMENKLLQIQNFYTGLILTIINENENYTSTKELQKIKKSGKINIEVDRKINTATSIN